MEYSKLISITGTPGLFEYVSAKNDGAIVRSLDDKSTKFVSNRLQQFSQIVNIEVFTVRENVNLIEVFQKMKASSEPLPSDKDAKAIKAYFQVVYPDMDFDRVYGSDMKKMVKWFVQLDAANVSLELPALAEEEVEEEVK